MSEEALADFDRAIKLRPDFGGAFDYRGYEYMKRGQYALALSDLNRAIQLMLPELARLLLKDYAPGPPFEIT
jgi:tetratricopeptide (TPR) repeat protein